MRLPDADDSNAVSPYAGTPQPEGSGLRRPAVWVPVLLVLGAVGAFLALRRGGAPAAAGPRAVPVTTATATKGDLPVTLTGLGTVTALETVTVRSRVDGHLVRVAFQEGQLVKEGDLLAEIDPRPFQVQLMQAEGQLAKDTAAFRNASADLERIRSLIAQGIVSRQQLDTQTAAVDQYAAAMKSDQAQVESAKLNLTYSRITAPTSGRVGLRLVDPGNMVRASDATGLAVIAPTQPINVLFTIPADAIRTVMDRTRRGDKLAVEAWDRDMKTRLAVGSLAGVDNQVDAATGTVKLKGLFPNADSALFPNQFVNARLQVDVLRDAVQVPTAALQRSPQGTFVYVVKAGTGKDGQPEHTAELQNVEVRATEGDATAIAKGLKGGEVVVTDGLDKLRPGSRIALPGQGADRKGKP